MKTVDQHSYTSIDATIIADSKNEHGNRLTTFIVTLPRIVLAEFNTHRMLSRNSASSRAIPFEKMVQRCQETPFIPIKWQKDHKGMQGTEYFEDLAEIDNCKGDWLYARDGAVVAAMSMNNYGLTKQLCNRLLEPFMWHTVIVTASEWENFFALRAHPAAEIHIAKLAEVMLSEYNDSDPKQLKAGEWHIPFGDDFDYQRLCKATWVQKKDPLEQLNHDEDYPEFDQLPGDHLRYAVNETKVKVAIARCARISYLNFEGEDDYKADVKLHDRLSEMGHWSPFEHCAKAMDESEFEMYSDRVWRGGDEFGNELPLEHGWCGNFRGFVQYRKTFKQENKSDSRVIKK